MSQSNPPLLADAFAHHQGGRLPLAEQLYRQLLAQQPQHAEACDLLGVLCLQTNRASEAVELIGRAVAANPHSTEYLNHLGAAYSALNQHDAAVAALRRAVQLDPRASASHYNLGTALRNAGRKEEALASFQHAVAANPASAEAHYNLGNTLAELERPVEAEASFRAALAARPNYLKAMINLGNALRDQGRVNEAVKVLSDAVALSPDHGNAHLNLGTALRDQGKFAEATRELQAALTLQPNQPEVHNNLGTIFEAQGQYAESQACFDRALGLDPEFADAHFGRAVNWLRSGDLERGFAEYEWRWKCKTFKIRPFPQPRWQGENLAGRTLLLYAEQGLGDALQFVRYADIAHERGARVIVECQPVLFKLLESCPFIDELVAINGPLPPFDVHAPLMSLPGILKLSHDQLWTGPYITANAALVEKWQTTLAPYQGFRVGLCWQGNTKHQFDFQRSFPLSLLAAVAQLPGVRLISLQKHGGIDQIAAAPFEVIELGPDLDEAAGAFVDTAAVMRNLDLVISCDTAIAHLAGALGVNTWLPLSASSDWRWMKDRTDSPWYPSIRLFRQMRLGEWNEVFECIAAELEALLATRE